MPSIFRRKRTWFAIVLLLIVLAPVALVAFVALQPAPPPPRTSGEKMHAVLYRDYGSPDVLVYGPADKLVPGEGQVLVKVRAASANPLDWHYVRGLPLLMRLGSGLSKPQDPRIGTDLSGEIVAVGPNVARFKVGDAVFGAGDGAFGEFALAREKNLATKPPSLPFDQAAALPIAAITALQAIRDVGRVVPGRTVLVNGASGGVGTFAVQIAKAYGATVTGVCSTRNVELVRSLGADAVIDYKASSFVDGPAKYDVIVDNVGNYSIGDLRAVLNPGGVLVRIGAGGPEDAKVGLKFVGDALLGWVYGKVGDRRSEMLIAKMNAADLATLARMTGTGQLKVVIDRTFPLEKTADALRYLETGRARGKVIVSVAPVEQAAPAANAEAGAVPGAEPATGATPAANAAIPATPAAAASPE
jgi:NADPH:quinone reductase-like Zn-dependent oxidoreductase